MLSFLLLAGCAPLRRTDPVYGKGPAPRKGSLRLLVSTAERYLLDWDGLDEGDRVAITGSPAGGGVERRLVCGQYELYVHEAEFRHGPGAGSGEGRILAGALEAGLSPLRAGERFQVLSALMQQACEDGAWYHVLVSAEEP